MKKIIMLKGDYCPYCRQAFQFMDQLYKDHPEYRKIELTTIDEITEEMEAKKYQYRVVPTYIIDNKIVFSGILTKENIRQVFEKAMEK